MKDIALFVTAVLILGSSSQIFSDVNASHSTSNTVSPGSTLNLYLSDDDLNLNRSGFDSVSTEGLLEFSINGIPISGPKTMIETSQNSGIFLIKLNLPTTINGIPVDDDDVLLVKYNDQSDSSGNPRTITMSTTISKSISKLDTPTHQRIGHKFTVMLYEPDANLDSKDVDRIPLRKIQFRADGGIRTTLANPAFDANSNFLLETGPNTDTFTVKIKIPRTIDGKVVHIGSSYELRYIDVTSPSGDAEKIKSKGRIG